MPAVVVALVLQLAWLVVRIVLEHNGIAIGNARVVALSVGSLAASYAVIAAAAAGLARRLTGTRRVGAWIATVASLVVIAGVVLYEALLHSSMEDPRLMDWAIELRVRGWSIADAIVILGFAIAAGRTGWWLAPPTVGLALMKVQLGLSNASWPSETLLVLLAVKAALLVVIASAAERSAAPTNPDPARAHSALRRCEVAAWLALGFSPISDLAWYASPTIYVAIATACAGVGIAGFYATAAWSMASAALAKSPRWAWYAAAMMSVWGLGRTLRVWLVTFVLHWNDLEGTPLKTVHWSAAVPGLLASLCALGALAVYGRRVGGRDLWLAAMAATTLSVVAFSVRCALPDQKVATVICYVVANLAAVRAYRVARLAIDGNVPRARVV